MYYNRYHVYIFLTVKTSCANYYQCENGGTPVEVDGCCTCCCPDGYTGDQCETCVYCYSHNDLLKILHLILKRSTNDNITFFLDIDICEDWTCYNGGTPVEEDGCCTCKCCEPYSGDHCENGISFYTVLKMAISQKCHIRWGRIKWNFI